MIVGSVTDEISMPMEARPIFHIEIPLWCTSRPRNIFFSPYEQMNEPRLSYLQHAAHPSKPMQRERERDDLSEKPFRAVSEIHLLY